jgi:hypothetical protein
MLNNFIDMNKGLFELYYLICLVLATLQIP